MPDLTPVPGFPARRLRRLRRTPALRRLVAETTLSVDDLVAPLFVADGLDAPRPVGSLPGVSQHTVDSLVAEVRRLAGLGVPGVILFPLPRDQDKDATGSAALSPDGITRRAIEAVRDAVGDDLVVMADCCLDEFTDHGHCGIVDPDTGDVDNDATVELYADLAVVQATAGAHVIAPSGMMDGQVAAIRGALDRAGHTDDRGAGLRRQVRLGPLRPVPRGGRRDHRRRRGPEGLPAGLPQRQRGARRGRPRRGRGRRHGHGQAGAHLPRRAGRGAGTVDVPVAAYHVCGEYAMVKAAAERGWIDGPAVALEQITAVKRAGADFVLTYFAGELAEALDG